MPLVTILGWAMISVLSADAAAQSTRPEVLRISPTSGPEGSRVTITGRNLQGASDVTLGAASSIFSIVSSEQIVTRIAHKSVTSPITVVTPRGSASSPFAFVVSNDPRVPDEVAFKAGYVNAVPVPRGFTSAMLWGIAIADSRVSGYQLATVQVASTQLSCRANGRGVILNDDSGNVRGGLYRRDPWFAGNQPEPMPVSRDLVNHVVVLSVGQRPDRVWHFWAASPRAALPAGMLEGCTVKAQVKISAGALLQVGMDYWRNPSIGFGAGGNNHEAGVSNWYFPSSQWQEAVFTDIGGPLF